MVIENRYKTITPMEAFFIRGLKSTLCFMSILFAISHPAILAEDIVKPKLIFEDKFENYPLGAFSKTKRKDSRIGFPSGIGLGFWRIGQVGGLGPFGKEEIVKYSDERALKIDRTSNENEPEFKRNFIEAVFEKINSGIITIKVDFWVSKSGDTFNVALRQDQTPLVILDLNGERSGCAKGELRYVVKYPKPMLATCTGIKITLNVWHSIEIQYSFKKGATDFYSVLLDNQSIIKNQKTVNDYSAAYIDNLIFEDWSKGDDNNYFLIDNFFIFQNEENTISMSQALIEYANSLPKEEREKLLAYIQESNKQVQENNLRNEKLSKEIDTLNKELLESKSTTERWRNLSRNMEDKMFHSLMNADQDFLTLKNPQDFKALQDSSYAKAYEHIKSKNYEQAIILIDELTLKYPETLLIKIAKSRALFKMGKAEEARKLFRSFLLQYVDYVSGN